MMEKKVLIHIQEKELAPHGGPVAVCYYYNEEQKKRGDNFFSFLHDLKANENLHERENKLLSNVPSFLMKLYRNVKIVLKYNKLLGFKYPTTPIDYSKYDIIHFHDTLSLYVRRYELMDFKGKIILQSHSPKPFGQEQIDSIPRNLRKFIPFINRRFEKMDRFAFERADYIVFPCEYAEEPYYNNWPNYKHIHEKKKSQYRYLLTGIPLCCPKRNRLEVRNELEILDNDFMICYVGRHNEVKGYGQLKEIGKKILSQTNDTWVICAGKEAPLKRLDHERWKEIGWTNDAHSYINAADVFVLPNKETYFDIVMLEVLSIGKIVVASRTGGNKFFEKKGCSGVFLYNTIEEAKEILFKIKAMSAEERHNLEVENKEFYNTYLTVEHMYDNYINLLKSI